MKSIKNLKQLMHAADVKITDEIRKIENRIFIEDFMESDNSISVEVNSMSFSASYCDSKDRYTIYSTLDRVSSRPDGSIFAEYMAVYQSDCYGSLFRGLIAVEIFDAEYLEMDPIWAPSALISILFQKERYETNMRLLKDIEEERHIRPGTLTKSMREMRNSFSVNGFPIKICGKTFFAKFLLADEKNGTTTMYLVNKMAEIVENYLFVTSSRNPSNLIRTLFHIERALSGSGEFPFDWRFFWPRNSKSFFCNNKFTSFFERDSFGNLNFPTAADISRKILSIQGMIISRTMEGLSCFECGEGKLEIQTIKKEYPRSYKSIVLDKNIDQEKIIDMMLREDDDEDAGMRLLAEIAEKTKNSTIVEEGTVVGEYDIRCVCSNCNKSGRKIEFKCSSVANHNQRVLNQIGSNMDLLERMKNQFIDSEFNIKMILEGDSIFSISEESVRIEENCMKIVSIMNFFSQYSNSMMSPEVFKCLKKALFLRIIMILTVFFKSSFTWKEEMENIERKYLECMDIAWCLFHEECIKVGDYPPFGVSMSFVTNSKEWYEIVFKSFRLAKITEFQGRNMENSIEFLVEKARNIEKEFAESDLEGITDNLSFCQGFILSIMLKSGCPFVSREVEAPLVRRLEEEGLQMWRNIFYFESKTSYSKDKQEIDSAGIEKIMDSANSILKKGE